VLFCLWRRGGGLKPPAFGGTLVLRGKTTISAGPSPLLFRELSKLHGVFEKRRERPHAGLFLKASSWIGIQAAVTEGFASFEGHARMGWGPWGDRGGPHSSQIWSLPGHCPKGPWRHQTAGLGNAKGFGAAGKEKQKERRKITNLQAGIKTVLKRTNSFIYRGGAYFAKRNVDSGGRLAP